MPTASAGNHTASPASDEDGEAFARAVEAVRLGATTQAEAKNLYDQLSDAERLGLLDGDDEIWPHLRELIAEGYNVRPYVHGEVARLGIPGIRFVDGPRGCVAGHGTAFPVAMARGATWDVELEQEIGEAIGREVRAQGGNFFGGVCVNLPRHPAWGRIQETYGDDPHHLGEFGAALARGAQKFTMACVKHFALNSMENARYTVDVLVDDATLHDVYLPHFKRAIDQDISAVMASYNSVNGEWVGQNRELLTGVLREQWGWGGITVTDFMLGFRDGALALEAGMDLEEPASQIRATHLRRQLEEGETSWTAVERSGVRLLAAQLRSYAQRETDVPGEEIMACESHRQLARKAAARSMVLLKNEPVQGVPVLPIDQTVRSIAVIGRLAVAANTGDNGSSSVKATSSVTPVDGIRSAFPNAIVTLFTNDDPIAAAEAAANADIAVIIVGYTAADEGEYVPSLNALPPELAALFPPMPEGFVLIEKSRAKKHAAETASAGPSGEGVGGDRASLRLRPIDEQIITAVAAANSRTVVAIVAAGAVITETWRAQVPATLIMWYAGMEGGHALADVLTGRQNPSGRLPFSIPTSDEHLPFFDRDATSITYDRFHGQRLLDRLEAEAAYPHGFGLSYTTFSIVDAVVIDWSEHGPQVRVAVHNNGDVDGRHVVQIYGRRSTGNYADELLLTGFAIAAVPADTTVEITVDVSMLALAEWDPTTRQRVKPKLSDVTLEVSSFAHDPSAILVEMTDH